MRALGNIYNFMRNNYPQFTVIIYNSNMRVEVGGGIGYVYITELDVPNMELSRFYVVSNKEETDITFDTLDWGMIFDKSTLWDYYITEGTFCALFRHRVDRTHY